MTTDAKPTPPSLEALIARGFRLTPEEANQCTGQEVIPRALDWEPQGSRMFVVVDEVPEKIGLIEVPPSMTDMEQMGSGWVVSVGPEAGLTVYGPLGNIMVDRLSNVTADPSELLGLHVMFGFHAGKAIRFSIFDSDYKSSVLLISPYDIWAVDFNADPLSADRDFSQAWALTTQGKEVQAEADAVEAEAEQDVLLERVSTRIITPGHE